MAEIAAEQDPRRRPADREPRLVDGQFAPDLAAHKLLHQRRHDQQDIGHVARAVMPCSARSASSASTTPWVARPLGQGLCAVSAMRQTRPSSARIRPDVVLALDELQIAVLAPDAALRPRQAGPRPCPPPRWRCGHRSPPACRSSGEPSPCACIVPETCPSAMPKACATVSSSSPASFRAGRRAAESPRCRRAEEAQPGFGGKAEPGGDVRAHGDRFDQPAAGNAALALGKRHGGREQHRHGMHHRAFVDAIIFRVVELVGVERRSGRGRQHFASSPRPAPRPAARPTRGAIRR